MKWLTRIRRALKRGHFTEEDESLAENWETCMVSERPRTRHVGNAQIGEPVSQRIKTLGMEFYDAVRNDEPEKALELRRQILKK